MNESHVIVEMLPVEGKENAYAFLFERDDGRPLTPQECIDAMADFFLTSDPTCLESREGTGH